MNPMLFKIMTLVFFGVGVYGGFANGLFGGVAVLVGTLVASLLAANFHAMLADLFRDKFLGNAADGATFIVIFCLVMVILIMLADFFLKNKVKLSSWVDRIGGAAAGLGIGVVLAGSLGYAWKLLPFHNAAAGAEVFMNADEKMLAIYSNTSQAMTGSHPFDIAEVKTGFIPDVPENLVHLGYRVLEVDEGALPANSPVLESEDNFYKALERVKGELGPEVFIARDFDHTERTEEKLRLLNAATTGKAIYEACDFTFRKTKTQQAGSQGGQELPLAWERNPQDKVKILVLWPKGNVEAIKQSDFVKPESFPHESNDSKPQTSEPKPEAKN